MNKQDFQVYIRVVTNIWLLLGITLIRSVTVEYRILSHYLAECLKQQKEERKNTVTNHAIFIHSA